MWQLAHQHNVVQWQRQLPWPFRLGDAEIQIQPAHEWPSLGRNAIPGGYYANTTLIPFLRLT